MAFAAECDNISSMDIFPFSELCCMSPTPGLPPPLKPNGWSPFGGGGEGQKGCAPCWSAESAPLENDTRWSPPPRFGGRTVETCIPFPVCSGARPCSLVDRSSDSCCGTEVFTGKVATGGAWFCGWKRGQRVKHRLPRDCGQNSCIVLVP